MKKEFSDEVLKRVGMLPTKTGNITYRKVGSNMNNLKVQEEWGQNWNLGNLQTLENLHAIGNRKENFDLIDETYSTLLSLNPILNDIPIPGSPKDKYANVYKDAITSAKLDIIRGVASGLNFNDVKYFVQDLKGNAKNESLSHAIKERLAYRTFKKRYGETIEFALSPETIKRIKENKPYQQSPKKFKEDEKKGKNSLEGKIISGLFILSFLAGIILIPSSLTGNIIGENVYSVILNIKNPLNEFDNENYRKELKNYESPINPEWINNYHLTGELPQYKYDGTIRASRVDDGRSITVRSPNQVHILGSKKDIEGFKKYVKKSKDTLENKVISGIFILIFTFSLFLLSPNLTGNIIGISETGRRFIGIILFLLSISGFFIYKKLRS
ncbi:MAG: hypothetical protein NTZ83_06570 [Candidatus Pacearchaeota archaeon]|nr:hypothetical protein [Candidatus Pacearchaeota archaeon]